MLEIRIVSRFKRDLKKAERQGRPMLRLKAVIDLLAKKESLPPVNRDHALTGNYFGHRECHVGPDWLLIYKLDGPYLILVRLGTHSELFS